MKKALFFSMLAISAICNIALSSLAVSIFCVALIMMVVMGGWVNKKDWHTIRNFFKYSILAMLSMVPTSYISEFLMLDVFYTVVSTILLIMYMAVVYDFYKMGEGKE